MKVRTLRMASVGNLLVNENYSHYSHRMIVCVCHRVSDRDIAHAVRDGCGSFDELQFELGVATQCGSCLDCARETFDRHVGPVCVMQMPRRRSEQSAGA